jgi:hypothetical protein
VLLGFTRRLIEPSSILVHPIRTASSTSSRNKYFVRAHILATAAIAAGTLFRGDPDQPARPRPAGPMPRVTSPTAALAWLDAQRSTLVAVAVHAADHGWAGHAIGLAATIFRYLDVGYFADAAAMHGHARRAAAQSGDRIAEAAALTMLGAAILARTWQACRKFGATDWPDRGGSGLKHRANARHRR